MSRLERRLPGLHDKLNMGRYKSLGVRVPAVPPPRLQICNVLTDIALSCDLVILHVELLGPEQL